MGLLSMQFPTNYPNLVTDVQRWGHDNLSDIIIKNGHEMRTAWCDDMIACNTRFKLNISPLKCNEQEHVLLFWPLWRTINKM